MKPSLYDALAQSLSLLEEGQASVEECLARYPDYAGDLRPLLEMALQVRRIPPPVCSPTAFVAGNVRVLEALAEKTRRRAARSRLIVALGSAMALFVCAAIILVLAMPVAGKAELVQVNGVVEILHFKKSMDLKKNTWQLASLHDQVERGDQIRTGPGSTAMLVFDGTTTTLGSRTQISVRRVDSCRIGAVISLYQVRGQTDNLVQLPPLFSRFEIKTPAAVAAVRGTRFTITVDDDGTTHVMVDEEVVEVTPKEGPPVDVLAGERVIIKPGGAPQTPTPTPTPSPTSRPTATTPPPPPPSPTAIPPTSTPTPIRPTPTPAAPPPPPPPPPPPTSAGPPQPGP